MDLDVIRQVQNECKNGTAKSTVLFYTGDPTIHDNYIIYKKKFFRDALFFPY